MTSLDFTPDPPELRSTSLLRKLRTTLEGGGYWRGDARVVLKLLEDRKFASEEVVQALQVTVISKIFKRSPLSEPISTDFWEKPTWGALEDAFWEVYRTQGYAGVVRGEAYEIAEALALCRAGIRQNRVQSERPSSRLGRVCKWCWRTEDYPSRRGRRHEAGYGTCYVHGGAIDRKLLEGHPRVSEGTVADAVSAVARSRRLIRGARLRDRQRDLCRPKNAGGNPAHELLGRPDNDLSAPGRPTWVVDRPRHSPDLQVVRWSLWVRQHFPLSVTCLSLTEGELATSVRTISAIEARKLTEAELSLLEHPSAWLPPLNRCEA